MQAAHALGGLDVDGVFGLNVLHLVARQQAKEPDVFVQVLQLKRHRFARGQVAHAKAGKVAHHHQLGQVALGQVVQVANGLV